MYGHFQNELRALEIIIVYLENKIIINVRYSYGRNDSTGEINLFSTVQF